MSEKQADTFVKAFNKNKSSGIENASESIGKIKNAYKAFIYLMIFLAISVLAGAIFFTYAYIKAVSDCEKDKDEDDNDENFTSSSCTNKTSLLTLMIVFWLLLVILGVAYWLIVIKTKKCLKRALDDSSMQQKCYQDFLARKMMIGIFSAVLGGTGIVAGGN